MEPATTLTTNEEFAAALAHVAEFGKMFSKKDQRQLYGLEMQALQGDLEKNEVELDEEDPEKAHKIGAWRHLAGKEEEDCRKSFVEIVRNISPSFKPEISLGSANAQEILEKAKERTALAMKPEKSSVFQRKLSENTPARPILQRPNVRASLNQRNSKMRIAGSKNNVKSSFNVAKGGKETPKKETFNLYGDFDEQDEEPISKMDEIEFDVGSPKPVKKELQSKQSKGIIDKVRNSLRLPGFSMSRNKSVNNEMKEALDKKQVRKRSKDGEMMAEIEKQMVARKEDHQVKEQKEKQQAQKLYGRERLRSKDKGKPKKESLRYSVEDALLRISKQEDVLRGSFLETGIRMMRTKSDDEMEELLQTPQQKELKLVAEKARETLRGYNLNNAFESVELDEDGKEVLTKLNPKKKEKTPDKTLNTKEEKMLRPSFEGDIPEEVNEKEFVLEVQPIDDDAEEVDRMNEMLPPPIPPRKSSVISFKMLKKLSEDVGQNNLNLRISEEKHKTDKSEHFPREKIEQMVKLFYEKHNKGMAEKGIETIIDYAVDKGIPRLNRRLTKKYGEGLESIEGEMQKMESNTKTVNEEVVPKLGEVNVDLFLSNEYLQSELELKRQTEAVEQKKRSSERKDKAAGAELDRARKFKKRLVEFLLDHEPDRVDKCLYLMTRFKEKNGIVRLNRKLVKVYGVGIEIKDLTEDTDMDDLRREFEDLGESLKKEGQLDVHRVDRTSSLLELTKKDAEMLSLYFAKHDTKILQGDSMERLHGWTDTNGVASLNRRLKRRYDEDLDEFVFSTNKLRHELTEFYSLVDRSKLAKGFDVVLRWGVINGRQALNGKLNEKYGVTLDSPTKALRGKSASFVEF